VKEIRETPHKKHHKFIEFYDVRAAEAALKALNRSDIAGKRIKLEPSRPGGARRNLMLQLNQELDRDESRGFRHQIGSPLLHSPPSNWVHFNSPIKQSPLQSINKSPVFRNVSPTTGNHLPGLASILHPQASNSMKVGPIGNNRGNNGHSSLGDAFQHPHSCPETKLSQHPGMISSFSSSTSNGSGVETLSGPEFLWGSPNPNSDKNNLSSWSRPSIGHPYSFDGKGHGFLYTSQHDFVLGSSQQHHHRHHVGSAPSGVPVQRHFGFFPESTKSSFMNHASFGHNDTNFMMNIGSRAYLNSAAAMPRHMSENGYSSLRMMPSPRPSPVFSSNGPYPGLTSSSMGGFIDYGRSRPIENNGVQVDNNKQFQLDLDKIISGDDPRTTLMIKNIPNKYSSKMLLAAIDENFRGTYDFFYLPIDFKNKCNVGYAFINMLSPSHIIRFYEVFNDKKWEKFNSEKVASLAYARIQGKTALVAHFQNSSLLNEDMRCRPIVFHSEGSEVVDQENLHSHGLNIQTRQPNESASGYSPPGSLAKDGSGEKQETADNMLYADCPGPYIRVREY
jgi:RNA recognition motif-containing protein